MPCSVHMANPAQGPTENELNIAYIQARSVRLALLYVSACQATAHTILLLSYQRGLRVKFVLLTNPNNPLGVIYKPEVIRSTIRWARKRSMHTIVDEIYALSTHKVRTRDSEIKCTLSLLHSVTIEAVNFVVTRLITSFNQ